MIYFIARCVGLTLRYQLVGHDAYRGVVGGKIALIWHGRTYPPGQYFGKENAWVIVSQSRDGEIQNRILKKMGYNVIRGSTGRGGERALIESIRCLRQGNEMALTPDGPRGPSGIVQMGVMVMAKKSGATLCTMGISARPRFLFKSWDRHMLPLPFSQVVVLFGKQFKVPANATDEEVEAIRAAIQVEMHRAQDEAEALLGFKTVSKPVETGPAEQEEPGK